MRGKKKGSTPGALAKKSSLSSRLYSSRINCLRGDTEIKSAFQISKKFTELSADLVINFDPSN
jgi:hypothetical protein